MHQQRTTVIFFVGTINKDKSYKRIIEYLDKKKINHIDHDCITENGVDHLEELINLMKNEKNDDDTTDSSDEEVESKYKILAFDETDDEIKIKIRKRRLHNAP